MDFKKLNINVVFIVIVAILSTFFMQTKNQINVRGECLKKITKDKVSVQIDVKNLAPLSSTANEKSTFTYNKISEYITTLKKEYRDLEIETNRYQTYEKFEYNPTQKKDKSIGFESVIGLSITADKVSLIENILAEVSKLNDVAIGGFNAFVSKDLMKKEIELCIQEAVKNANSKAAEIAKSNNQNIGKMTSANLYQTVSDSFPQPYNGARMMSMGKVETSTKMDKAQIFMSTQEISLDLNATFELK